MPIELTAESVAERQGLEAAAPIPLRLNTREKFGCVAEAA